MADTLDSLRNELLELGRNPEPHPEEGGAERAAPGQSPGEPTGVPPGQPEGPAGNETLHPAFAAAMKQWRDTAIASRTEAAMSSEWLKQGKDRADKAAADAQATLESLESPDADANPDALLTAHRQASLAHQHALSFQDAVQQYEAARLSRGEGFDTVGAMEMGNAPVDWARQGSAISSLPRAGARGIITGAGTAVSGTGRAIEGMGVNLNAFVRHQISVMDTIDAGGVVAPMDDAMGYADMTPAERQAARKKVMDELASSSPPGSGLQAAGKAVRETVGDPIQAFTEKMLPIDPAIKDHFLVRSAEMAGGFVPYMVVASLVGVPGVMAVAGAQSYESTFREAKEKGASEQDAHRAAAISAFTNAGLMSVPISRWMEGLPGLFKDSMVRATAALAQEGVVLTSVMQAQKLLDNIIAKTYYDPDRALSEGMGQDLPEQVLVGALFPAAVHGVKAVPGLLRGRGKGVAEEAMPAPSAEAEGTPAAAGEPDQTGEQQAREHAQFLMEELALDEEHLAQLDLLHTPEAASQRQVVEERIAAARAQLSALQSEGKSEVGSLGRETPQQTETAERPSSNEGGWYTLSDAISGEGPTPERVRLSQDGNTVIREGGFTVDVSKMRAAGYTPERRIAAAIGHDQTGKNVRRETRDEAAAAPEPEEQAAVAQREADLDHAVDVHRDDVEKDLRDYYAEAGYNWDLTDEDVRGVGKLLVENEQQTVQEALDQYVTQRRAELLGEEAIDTGARAPSPSATGEAEGAEAGLGAEARDEPARVGPGEPEPSAGGLEPTAARGRRTEAEGGRGDRAGSAEAGRAEPVREPQSDAGAERDAAGSGGAVPRSSGERGATADERGAPERWQRTRRARITQQFRERLRQTGGGAEVPSTRPEWSRELQKLGASPEEAREIIRSGLDVGWLRVDRSGAVRRGEGVAPSPARPKPVRVSPQQLAERGIQERERLTGRVVQLRAREHIRAMEADRNDPAALAKRVAAVSDDRALGPTDRKDIAAVHEAITRRLAADADRESAAREATRKQLRQLIASSVPVPDWADRLGISSEELRTEYLPEAIAQGLLRTDVNGIIRRTKLAKVLPAETPIRAPEAALAIPPELRVMQRERIYEYASGGTPTTLAERLTPATGGSRAKRAEIGQRAAEVVRKWANDLEKTVGTPEFDGVLADLKRNTTVRGRPKKTLGGQFNDAQIREVARLFGLDPTDRTSLKKIFEDIKKRHDDAVARNNRIEMASFVGENAAENLAVTGRPAAQDALDMAMTMEEQGADRDAIWRQTAAYLAKEDPALIGVYRGVDGKWRIEIDDASLKSKIGKGQGLAEGALVHKELAVAYPESDVLTSITKRGPHSGMFGIENAETPYAVIEGKTPIARRDIAAHELQHFSQAQEGFAPGGNTNPPLKAEEVARRLKTVFDDLLGHLRSIGMGQEHLELLGEAIGLALERGQPIPKAPRFLQTPEGDRLYTAFADGIRDVAKTLATAQSGHIDPYQYYRHLAGEVEARNVERRLYLTANERRQSPPWETQDIPDAKQIALSPRASAFSLQLSKEAAHIQKREFDRLGFYSSLLETAKAKLPAKGTPEQMLGILRNAGGVKEAEIKATGLDQFLAQRRGPPLQLPDVATREGLEGLIAKASSMHPDDVTAVREWLASQEQDQAKRGADIARECISRPAGFSITS